jgi:hypothetical protein
MTKEWGHPENDAQRWNHCWLNINNEDWWIGAIETRWDDEKKVFKRWLRLWRDEAKDQTAFISLDMARVDWTQYTIIACEMLSEQMLKEDEACQPKRITPRTASRRSISTRRLPRH